MSLSEVTLSSLHACAMRGQGTTLTETSSLPPQPAIVFLDMDDVLCLNAPYGGHAVIQATLGRHPNPQDVYERVFHARTRRVLKAG